MRLTKSKNNTPMASRWLFAAGALTASLAMAHAQPAPAPPERFQEAPAPLHDTLQAMQAAGLGQGAAAYTLRVHSMFQGPTRTQENQSETNCLPGAHGLHQCQSANTQTDTTPSWSKSQPTSGRSLGLGGIVLVYSEQYGPGNVLTARSTLLDAQLSGSLDSDAFTLRTRSENWYAESNQTIPAERTTACRLTEAAKALPQKLEPFGPARVYECTETSERGIPPMQRRWVYLKAARILVASQFFDGWTGIAAVKHVKAPEIELRWPASPKP